MKTIQIALITAGTAMAAYGLYLALTLPSVKLERHGIFLVFTLLLNDAILAPVFLAVGVIVRRLIRPPYRAVVQGALIITAAVTFVALPFMLGYGRIADNPSALPRNYIGGYAIILGAIWAGATILIVWREIAHKPASAGTRRHR